MSGKRHLGVVVTIRNNSNKSSDNGSSNSDDEDKDIDNENDELLICVFNDLTALARIYRKHYH